MKILVGLSGGVDSAVSAYLLKQEGHEVSCGFMINYLDEQNPENCPTLIDIEEAKKVAQYLNLPFYTFDYREEYEKRIIEYIYREYGLGRTPNPDVFCNNLVKFDLFLEEALSLGFDAIATGHYARNTSSPSLLLKEKEVYEITQREDSPSLKERGQRGEVFLLKGIDPSKDQSYFLSRLSQFQLSKSLFPLGHLLKSEVRNIARNAQLPNAERKDSQGLCFIGKVSMKEFLERRIEKFPGDIITTEGKVIGEHEGAFSYTIGQRKGIKVGGGPALFVIAKDIGKNTVTVGTMEELNLYSDTCTITDWTGSIPEVGKTYGAKIRYRQEDQEVILNGECGMVNYKTGKGQQLTIYHLQFTIPQRAIASGQICVIYDGELVIGSGVIIK